MDRRGWSRITEVRGKGGESNGLRYHFPCGHETLVGLAAIDKYLKGGVDAPDPAPVVCPECGTTE